MQYILGDAFDTARITHHLNASAVLLKVFLARVSASVRNCQKFRSEPEHNACEICADRRLNAPLVKAIVVAVLELVALWRDAVHTLHKALVIAFDATTSSPGAHRRTH